MTGKGVFVTAYRSMSDLGWEKHNEYVLGSQIFTGCLSPSPYPLHSAPPLSHSLQRHFSPSHRNGDLKSSKKYAR